MARHNNAYRIASYAGGNGSYCLGVTSLGGKGRVCCGRAMLYFKQRSPYVMSEAGAGKQYATWWCCGIELTRGRGVGSLWKEPLQLTQSHLARKILGECGEA